MKKKHIIIVFAIAIIAGLTFLSFEVAPQQTTVTNVITSKKLTQ